MKDFNSFGKMVIGLFTVVGILFMAGTAAHHGWANYNEDITLEYTGTIQESGMENPHSYVKLDVKEEDEVWLVILAPPSRMQNRGVTEEMLKEGSVVSVVGHPHRKTEGEMRATHITIDDQTVGLR